MRVPSIGDAERRCPTQYRQNGAFREQLPDDSHACRAQRRAHGHLSLSAHSTDEQKVGDIGAGYQQHQAGDPHQQRQFGGIAQLHDLDATSAVGENDVGLFQKWLVMNR